MNSTRGSYATNGESVPARRDNWISHELLSKVIEANGTSHRRVARITVDRNVRADISDYSQYFRTEMSAE